MLVCIVLGQFVVDSIFYNILYPEHAQNCAVYNNFHSHNVSMGNITGAQYSNGTINYVIWSDVFECPNCGGEIVFWEDGVDQDAR